MRSNGSTAQHVGRLLIHGHSLKAGDGPAGVMVQDVFVAWADSGGSPTKLVKEVCQ
jgi:hypothetical protein